MVCLLVLHDVTHFYLQEARRIISAIQTNIHYYEYLPIIIGSGMISKYNLGSYAGFDEDVNPSVL